MLITIVYQFSSFHILILIMLRIPKQSLKIMLQWSFQEFLVIYVAKSIESKAQLCVYRYACGISNDLITESIQNMPTKANMPNKIWSSFKIKLWNCKCFYYLPIKTFGIYNMQLSFTGHLDIFIFIFRYMLSDVHSNLHFDL